MKKDIDQIMHQHHVDFLLVTGSGRHNPAMVYLAGMAHLTQADLIKKVDEAPVLYHASMEREEAAKTGLMTCSYNRYPMKGFLEKVDHRLATATALRYKQMLFDQGIIEGRMAVYGMGDIGWGYNLISELLKIMPGIDIVDQSEIDILSEAMVTKDADEIACIREMGVITVEVVNRVVERMKKCRVADGVLFENGTHLTIGQMKSSINQWLSELGAENPEDTIFSMGKDAGVPHNSGNNEDMISVGNTIVMDIFPCQAGGGYFYDFTRTWCLDLATDEVIRSYEQVLSVHDKIIEEIKTEQYFSDYQKMTCQMFEEMGHPTVMTDASLESGYVHGIGHGLGLNVHERPRSSMSVKDVIKPGMVMTVEPGLYYPEREYGIRIEDTIWVRPDGEVEIMAEFPTDLILRIG